MKNLNLYETVRRDSYVNYKPRFTLNRNSISKFSNDPVSNKNRSMPKNEDIFNRDYRSQNKPKAYLKK